MNIYRKLEDKWTMRQYNKVKDWEFNTFAPKSAEGKASLSMIRKAIRIMIISFLLTVLLSIALNPGGFITAWVFFMSWLVKGQIESKMFSGYPYLEGTNAMGIMLIGVPSFIIMAVLFVVTI